MSNEPSREVSLEVLAVMVGERTKRIEEAHRIIDVALRQAAEAREAASDARMDALAAISLAQKLYTAAEVEPLERIARLLRSNWSDDATDGVPA